MQFTTLFPRSMVSHSLIPTVRIFLPRLHRLCPISETLLSPLARHHGRVSLHPRSIHHNLIPLLLILQHVQR